MACEQAKNPFRLDGRRALITGAGGGIGRSLVAAFRAAGAAVVACDREIALMDGVEAELKLGFDVTDAAAARAALDGLDRDRLTPDILVSNAGGSQAEALEDVDDAAWQSEIALNLTGPYTLSSALAERMAERGGGAIVFIATVNGLAHYGNPAYSAAKAGLLALMRAIAQERGARGVRANAICPGSVRTPGWDHRFAKNPELLNAILPHYPLGRTVVPDEVARAAVFLASEAASGITGVALPVDAGLSAGNLRFVREVIGGGKS